MSGVLLALLVKAFAALFFLGVPYALAWWLWKVLPDSRVKRLLYKSWGDDHGPWIRRPRRITGPAAD